MTNIIKYTKVGNRLPVVVNIRYMIHNLAHLHKFILMIASLSAIFFSFTFAHVHAQENVATMTNQSISIKLQSKFDFANPNTDVDYQIVVTNTGSVPISQIVLTESWPDSFIINGLSGGFVTWTIPNLLPGQSEAKPLQLHVPSNTPAGTYAAQTLFISQQPAIQQTFDHSLEVRDVAILSAELPTTDGFSSMYLYAGALLLQLSLIATFSFHKAFDR